ncbi:MAG TPA: hypothetical protein VFF11_16695, partial [Candidatus Binatia bacterium]|nr:hypothetical protein [Candidatus Binatia bacterium]
WLASHASDKVEYLNTFDDNQDLPDNAGERIYGWFTPPVNGDYVFFISSDDQAALWLSTDSDPAHVYQIAQNQDWMDAHDWTCSDTGSGEYAYYGYGEWRSDQFELNGGPNAYNAYIYGWSQWPSLNTGNGGIPLVAGTKYYIELDHFQGNGGQTAAVTYKLAGNADPNTGDAPLLTGSAISATVPDTLVPEPHPVVANITVSGTNVTIHGGNGLVNAAFNVLSTTNVALPLSSWTVMPGGRFDANGNFSSTNSVNSAGQRFYIIQVP